MNSHPVSSFILVIDTLGDLQAQLGQDAFLALLRAIKPIAPAFDLNALTNGQSTTVMTKAFDSRARRPYDPDNQEDVAIMAKARDEISNELALFSTAVDEPAPKIELTKLKILERMSDDSTCFEAVVWVDGKAAFEAGNSGQGGSDEYHPIHKDGKADHEAFDAVMRRLKAYAGTLPVDTRHGHNFKEDVETLIGDLISEAQYKSDAKKFVRKLKDRVIWIDDGKLWESSRHQVTPATIQRFVAKYPSGRFLNTMSPAEAEAVVLEYLKSKAP